MIGEAIVNVCQPLRVNTTGFTDILILLLYAACCVYPLSVLSALAENMLKREPTGTFTEKRDRRVLYRNTSSGDRVLDNEFKRTGRLLRSSGATTAISG